MDGWLNLELVIAGLAGATFLWIGCTILVEGNRRDGATIALTAVTMALACLYYGELARSLSSRWWAIQDRLVGTWIAIAAVGWYAAAISYTRAKVPLSDWRWMQRVLIMFCGWAGILALARGIFLDTVSQSRWFDIAHTTQIHLTLGAGLLVYWHARRISKRGYGRLTWFIPTSLYGLVSLGGAILIDLAAINEKRVSLFVQWPGLLGALVGAALLLGVINTNHKLLGCPIRNRTLLIRWAILGLVFLTFQLLTDPQVQSLNTLTIAILTPLLVVMLDTHQYRFYQRYIDHHGRFIRHAIVGWPIADPQVCYDQADHIFDSLMNELRPDAGYLYLRTDRHEEPLILKHNWEQPPHPHAAKDWRSVEVGGQQIGFILLWGRRGSAYSSLELHLAETCAHTIAILYFYSQQARAFEEVIVQHNQERQDHSRRLQRVLHDQVVGNLDVVSKAAQLLKPKGQPHRRMDDIDFLDEIDGAAREAMAQIRALLHDQLTDLYPPVLLREGLIAALTYELIPRYQEQQRNHYAPVEITFDHANLDDTVLNAWLGDNVKRTLYAAIGEAVHNAVKHASGTTHRSVRLAIRLRHNSDGLVAEVQDTGVGFVPQQAMARGTGTGLHYHHAALRMAGGTMTLESRPNHGTTVRLQLPTVTLCRTQQNCVLHAMSQVARSGLEWARTVLTTEQHPGGRLLINDDLSDLTRTPEISEAYYRARVQDAAQIEQLADIDRQRQHFFASYVVNYPFKELIDRQRLQHYIATGITDDGRTAVTLALAHQHIRHVIQLLREHDNYYRALSDQGFDANFAIKPDYAVLWEQRAENGDPRIAGIFEGIRDTDPHVVAEFTRRFDAAWNDVPSYFRDKQAVIAWLEDQLAQAERLSRHRGTILPKRQDAGV